MWACARASEPRFRAVALGLVLGAASAWVAPQIVAAQGAPARVVSMNLCTDQLAMLIAAPGQLASVSHLAADPAMSSMAASAAGLAVNHGRAEELYLLEPDLVLADIWSSPATLSMLDRLSVPVARFTPGASLAEIRGNITRMGAVLGREARAAEVLAAFDARLAALPPVPDDPPRGALYGPNGYTYGPETLAGQILQAAGFANIAAEAGLDRGGTLALERLVMAVPELVISGGAGGGGSRAHEVLRHPALAGLRVAGAAMDANWACATPFVLDAVERLIAVRRGLEAGG